MRGDPQIAELGHEVGGVEALVASERATFGDMCIGEIDGRKAFADARRSGQAAIDHEAVACVDAPGLASVIVDVSAGLRSDVCQASERGLA